MKRRKALQQIGWGLSGGVLAPSLLSACGNKDPGPEVSYSGTVAVIGAGAAGLYVADILRSKGIKIKLFEARDQVGGRVRSLRNQSTIKYPFGPQLSSDFPVELGAQTIIGTDSIIGKIYQNYRLVSAAYPTSGNHYVLDNKAKPETGWGGDVDFVNAKNFRANLRNNIGSGQSVQAAVQAAVGTRAHGMLNGWIGNAYGGDNDTMGIGELAQEETLRLNDSTNDGKILGLSTNPMQDVVISRFSAVQQFVQLNTPITSINYAGDPIVLTAKDGSTYEVGKVVVTVPVSILKNESITFSPALPSGFKDSLAKIGMGASMRVVIEFKKNFWGDTVGFILGSANVPEYFSVGLGRSVFNRTLSITVNGAKAAQYSALGDGVVDAILADLDLLYAGQGTQFVRQDILTMKSIFVREDWTTMDYILGGYSYPLAGATNDDRKAIGQPISGKLFFAGEGTDITGQAGMVNGALASAERASIDVIKSILNP